VSSTNRGSQRMADDFYATPAWTTRAILRRLGREPSYVLEPTAGKGAIVRELRAHWRSSYIVAVELDADRCEQLISAGANSSNWRDFIEWEPDRSFDLAISNPPFEIAMPVIEKCLRISRETVMLLRLNFLGSQERASFLRNTKPDVHVLSKRPSFAASMRCAGNRASKNGDDRTVMPCEWREMFPLDIELPSACPQCGLKVTTSKTDSIEYAWFHWHPASDGRLSILDLREPDE
jgi:hypothetical protein